MATNVTPIGKKWMQNSKKNQNHYQQMEQHKEIAKLRELKFVGVFACACVLSFVAFWKEN